MPRQISFGWFEIPAAHLLQDIRPRLCRGYQCVRAQRLQCNKETKEKVKIAIEFAKLWKSEIKVLSVLIDDDEFIKNKLIRNLGQVEKFISDQNIKCSSELVVKNKSSKFFVSILDYTKSVEADLLIIMTQEEDSLTLNFLGSNASYLINNSNIPVMSVRPSIKKDTTSFGLV